MIERMKTMTALTLALTLLAVSACASPNANSVPGWNSTTSRQSAVYDKRGKIRLFPDTYGDPTPEGITAGPDGALWYIDPGMDVIGRVTTDGQYTLEQGTGHEVSIGIAAGADKNLWFTIAEEQGGVGRITTSGDVTIFSDPGGSYTQGIALGPDRALWFGESNGTIGRINAKGKVRHVTVSSNNAELEGLVAGPDGNVWVTELAVGSHLANKVFRVTTRGKVTAFTVGSGPENICVGPDKALWFTESASNAIGRLTTSGSYTQYSIGYKYGGVVGIAKGPDGALWFTESGRFGYIGRLTTSGKMKFFPTPGSYSPVLQQITAGPDGAMWFTSAMSPSAIGRISVR